MAAQDELVVEVRKITRLLCMVVMREMSQREQIQALSSAGFAPKEIADLIGTTPNTVRVTLSAIRRGASKAKARSRVQDD